MQRLVGLARDPQAVQEEYRELTPGHRHHGPLLRVFAAALGYLQAVTSQVGVLGEGAQDV